MSNTILGTADERFEKVNAQIKYMDAEIIPFLNEMEAWEAKEYRQVYNNYLDMKINLQNHISAHPEIFA